MLTDSLGLACPTNRCLVVSMSDGWYQQPCDTVSCSACLISSTGEGDTNLSEIQSTACPDELHGIWKQQSCRRLFKMPKVRVIHRAYAEGSCHFTGKLAGGPFLHIGSPSGEEFSRLSKTQADLCLSKLCLCVECNKCIKED